MSLTMKSVHFEQRICQSLQYALSELTIDMDRKDVKKIAEQMVVGAAPTVHGLRSRKLNEIGWQIRYLFH